MTCDYFTNSNSLGRQVLLSHGSSGPSIRRMMNQLLPGIVWIQFACLPVDALGEK